MKMLRTSFFVILFCATLVSRGVGQVTFRDITRQAGITVVHNSGATGKKWLPETMGAGAAFIDYDNHGYPDILLVNGKDWTTPGKPSTLKLYHNNGNGMFAGSPRAGLAISLLVWAAVGDDNDGFDDVMSRRSARATCSVATGHLACHQGRRNAGSSEFGTSAAWVDYDRDGKLDLIVVNYVQCDPGATSNTRTPSLVRRVQRRVGATWHNLGNAVEDATAKMDF